MARINMHSFVFNLLNNEHDISIGLFVMSPSFAFLVEFIKQRERHRYKSKSGVPNIKVKAG
ncbi:hypothetical protein TUM12370_09140 [Salmonella enterica subsp. enterica serovar Choleraesuis]|nr:hypothetical protein TUM12370_09140 [Salmonella enterica subsp. enterica serovar Choleraesuis]